MDKKDTVDSGHPVPLITDGGEGDLIVTTGGLDGTVAGERVFEEVADPSNPALEKER